MFKLIKYELRGNLTTILGICITLIVANLLLLTRQSAWGTQVTGGLSTTLSIVAITIIFISAFNLMGKYLYNDTGYLLFTLPQSGTKIILSKLLTALIQITLVIVVSNLGTCLATRTNLYFRFFNYLTIRGILYIIFIYIVLNITFLTFVYFCMVMGKVALRNKVSGKIGSFILFILLSIALAWLSSKLTAVFPQTITIDGTSFLKNINLTNHNSDLSIHLPICSLVSEVVTFVAFFVSSAYMLDNKLEL